MKYPKEYFKKALDIIERDYMGGEGEYVENTALLSLAAVAIGIVAFDNQAEWGVDEETAFYMVRGAIEKPEPYTKELAELDDSEKSEE